MQINRLFELIYLLLQQESMTAADAAARFEVSVRTIYRDVELLSSAGIPIYMRKGRGGGISLLPGFVLNKTVLTEREKADILSALYAVDTVSLETQNSAVGKLSSLFGQVNADWVEVDFSQWANGEEEAQLFSKIKEAILQKHRLHMVYYSGRGSTSRTVEPMKLYFKGQSWYLYAYCTLRKDCRFFKLRRIKQLHLLDEVFTRKVPEKLAEKQAPFADAFIEITLRLSPELAYRAYDEFPMCERLADGSFVVQFSMPADEWAYQYVSSFGEHAEVIAPPQLRAQMQERLQKMLDKYSKYDT